MKRMLKFLIVLVAVIAVGIVIETGASAAQPAKAKAEKPLVIIDPMVDLSGSPLLGNGKGNSTVLFYTDVDGNTLAIAEIPGKPGEPEFKKNRDNIDTSIEALLGGRIVQPVPAGEGTTYCTRRPPLDCVCLNEYKDCQSIVVN